VDRIGGFLPGATGVNTGLSRNKEKSQEIIKLYQEGYSSLKIAKIYSGNQSVYKKLLMLYKDATIYLDRKYERFLQLQNYINSRA